MDIICSHVKLFNRYKDYIDRQEIAEHFDSRSALHGSALEEFFTYLFEDIVSEFSENAVIGSVSAMKDIFFAPSSFSDLLEKSSAKIELKNHDFAIGVEVKVKIKATGSTKEEEITIHIPAVVIECKTYLDKTMLEGCANAADQLKKINPNAIYIVAAEWLKLTDAVNLSKYPAIDQIFCLRKQKNTDREDRYADDYVKNPVYPDMVFKLFSLVRDSLNSKNDGSMAGLVERGYLKD